MRTPEQIYAKPPAIVSNVSPTEKAELKPIFNASSNSYHREEIGEHN